MAVSRLRPSFASILSGSVIPYRQELIAAGCNEALLTELIDLVHTQKIKSIKMKTLYSAFITLPLLQRKRVSQLWELLCMVGSSDAIRVAIENGLTADTRNAWGANALHLAALSGSEFAIEAVKNSLLIHPEATSYSPFNYTVDSLRGIQFEVENLDTLDYAAMSGSSLAFEMIRRQTRFDFTQLNQKNLDAYVLRCKSLIASAACAGKPAMARYILNSACYEFAKPATLYLNDIGTSGHLSAIKAIAKKAGKLTNKQLFDLFCSVIASGNLQAISYIIDKFNIIDCEMFSHIQLNAKEIIFNMALGSASVSALALVMEFLEIDEENLRASDWSSHTSVSLLVCAAQASAEMLDYMTNTLHVDLHSQSASHRNALQFIASHTDDLIAAQRLIEAGISANSVDDCKSEAMRELINAHQQEASMRMSK